MWWGPPLYMVHKSGESGVQVTPTQRTVTTSSTEAELLALSHAAKDLYWWRRLFRNLTLYFEHDFTIQCDNQQTIRLIS